MMQIFLISPEALALWIFMNIQIFTILWAFHRTMAVTKT